MDAGRTVAVVDAIRARLVNQALAPGDRLPSIRRLAANMSVAPSTVVEAYDRLTAEGLVRSRRGSGFYVTGTGLPPMALAAAGEMRDPAVDPFWVSRQSLDADPAALRPGCGWLPADWMPHASLRRGLRTLARADEATLADYGATRGSPVLRRLLAGRFAGEGLDVTPGQLLLTPSGTQAVDLVCRLLLRAGDTVLVDDPCYFNFRTLLRAHQVRIVGVPYTRSGPDLDAFAAVLAETRPRLYLTNSAIHNPTGATPTAQTVHRLLALASAHDLTIVEDDIFAEFEHEPSPRLAMLDGLRQVVRIGSFSKTISASIRCGYVAARTDWIEALVDLQIATGFGGPSPVAAGIVADVLLGGGYRRHMEALRHRLTRARHDTAHRLEPLGIRPWLMPRGGFYLWCQLPDGLDSTAIAQAALAEGVVLAPGNVFSVSGDAAGFLRFNVAQAEDPRIYEVLARAMASDSA